MSRSKYSLESDILDGVERDDSPWRCYSTVVAIGDTLEELLENGTIGLLDQDGGDRGEIPLGYLPERLQILVEDELKRLIQEQDEGDADDPVGALMP